MPGTRTCGICGRKRPDLVPTAVLRPALVEIQQVQVELMNDLRRRGGAGG